MSGLVPNGVHAAGFERAVGVAVRLLLLQGPRQAEGRALVGCKEAAKNTGESAYVVRMQQGGPAPFVKPFSRREAENCCTCQCFFRPWEGAARRGAGLRPRHGRESRTYKPDLVRALFGCAGAASGV